MTPPEVFGRSINPILTGGHILPTTLLPAPDFQTFQRPCISTEGAHDPGELCKYDHDCQANPNPRTNKHSCDW